MNKLLELKKLENEVTELLYAVDRPEGIALCYHAHYTAPTISIYTTTTTRSGNDRILVQAGVEFRIDEVIDEQIAKDIIYQIEKVMQ